MEHIIEEVHEDQIDLTSKLQQSKQIHITSLLQSQQQIQASIIVANINHIRVVIIRVDNNKLTKKCTTANRGIRNIIIDYKHNKKSTFDLIGKIICTINRSNGSDNIDCNTIGTNRSNYSIDKLVYNTTKSTSDF